MSSFSAMIMSTNDSTEKNTNAGRYCSMRDATAIVLSRTPTITRSAIATITGVVCTNPLVFSGSAAASAGVTVPGSTSAVASAARNPR